MVLGDLLQRFAAPFERLSLRWMVTGGAAAIVYGEPRLTNDLDIVVAMGADDAARVAEAFADDETYVPPVEVLALEAIRPLHGHFNVIHGPSSLRADVYIAGGDSLHAWGLDHRRQIAVAGATIWIAPPEYVITRKLQYAAFGGGDRHLRDIRTMLDRQLVPLDQATMTALVESGGVGEAWAHLLRERS